MRNAKFHFDDPPQTLWERLIRAKAASPNIEDRRSFLMGLDFDSREPVCIPRSALEKNHYHVRGMTRSGKTAASLLPLILQILRGYTDAEGKPSPKSPVIILDLKGDQALFNATWRAALKAGQKFRYFSTRKNDDYYFFDPFQMFRLGHLLPVQLASQFVRAFSLDYGLIYGGLYFTQQNLVILNDAVDEMLRLAPADLKIETLGRILRRLSRAAQNSDARHIESCLKLLAAYPQVNSEKSFVPPHQQIDMLRALEDCEVLYFFLKMEGEAPSLRQIASLALYTLVEAANYRRERGLPSRDTYVIIDEFYHVAGKSFGELLSTVAGWGLHMVLSNQTQEQLANHDRALPDIVNANTGVKQAFTLAPDEEEYFKLASGEAIEYRQSYTRSANRDSLSIAEERTYYLSDPELKIVNDTLLASLALINDGKPHAPGKRVLKVQALFPLTKEEHERFDSTPFPQRPQSPIRSVSDEPAARPSQPHSSPAAQLSPEIAALDRRMQQKWQQLEEALIRD